MKRTKPSLLFSSTRAEDLRSLAIARAVFAEITTQILLDVDAVLAGRPVPTMSHVDRDRITAAALEIP